MLAVARERFARFANFEYIVADYTKHNFAKKFDMIISALSIHHLDAQSKKTLYENCRRWLKAGGIFINVDQVISPSPEIEKKFSDIWRKQVENTCLSKREIQEAYERVRFDNPSTVAEQLHWLQAAGFSQADVIYKYFHFCVFYAKW
jgi:tRNA (cmo5U34)-methyltransferase